MPTPTLLLVEDREDNLPIDAAVLPASPDDPIEEVRAWPGSATA